MQSANLEKIWSDFGQNLNTYILKKVDDKSIANDIVQDVFVKLHQNRERLKEVNNINAWLYRVAKNQIIDHYRAHKRSYEQITGSEISDKNEEGEETRSLAACMHSMIDALPPKYREAVRLADVDGLSQKALAEQLGISYSGAKSRVQRGREMLKDLFLECCCIEHDQYGNIIRYAPRDQCDF